MTASLSRSFSHRILPVAAAAALVLGAVAPAAQACPWHKSWFLFGAWVPVPAIPGIPGIPIAGAAYPALLAEISGHAGSPVTVPLGDPPSEVGRWQPPVDWPVIAIHAALLPTGEVLHYSYPDGDVGSNSKIWNPRTGVFRDAPIDTDIFCSGLSFLADGDLFVSGGNDYLCTFQGRYVTNTLDPFTGTWTAQENMSTGRWYPQNVTLGDGRVLIFSGLDRSCQTTAILEIFTPGVGIDVVPEGQFLLALYPRLHLLSDGRVAHVGPENQTKTFDLTAGAWEPVGFTNFGYRWDGTSFLVPDSPDEVMACGGSDSVVSNTCERIAFADAEPAWRFTASMNFARSHANAQILPDRTVLIVGGGTDGLYGDPVLNAELYDPDAETWTLLPAQVHGRMYHSTTVLLPDGRVISAGQDSGDSAYRAEVYEPPYLFKGPRPRITSAPRRVRYGTSFAVGTSDASTIQSVALISLTTVTHSVNNGQRYVGLDFSANGSEITATAPANGNLAPPGYYMLFIVNSEGVPSVARILRLSE